MAYNYKTELGRYRKYYQSLEPVFKKASSKAYTSVIFTFLAVSLFSWYAVRPTIQTILYLKREISDNVQINKQMEDKIGALIEAQAYYQEIEPLMPAVSQALPGNSEPLSIIIQLRNLASVSGVLLTAMQPATVPLLNPVNPRRPAENNSPLVSTKQESYTLSVTVEGPFTNVRSYLDGVINMRRTVSVEGFSLTPITTDQSSSPSANTTQTIIQLALQLKTYYLVE